MSEKLKPCPFCGEPARIRSEACMGGGVVFYAECGNRRGGRVIIKIKARDFA